MYKLCKTEQSAARQRELELALSEMMILRRYEDITVSEFCSHVGIPRKAFYRYFSSKDGALYALLDHTMLEYEHYRSPHTRLDEKSLLLETEHFYRFWMQQKPILDALEFSGLSGVLLERAISGIDSGTILKRLADKNSEFEQRQIARFVVSGLMIMMVNWHHDGYRESPREMAELTVRMITRPLLPYVMELI